LIRLAVPLASVSVFFLLSLATVRVLQPRDPKRFFFLYGAGLLALSAVVLLWAWPLGETTDALGLVACLLLQALACLTMWNAFYSLLWGFSGSMMYDLYNVAGLRDRDRLVGSYQGDQSRDRILARRMPNLERGGWVGVEEETLQLTSKGRVLALGTLAAFKVFSLGMGGGVK